jgi:hypothetical protein
MTARTLALCVVLSSAAAPAACVAESGLTTVAQAASPRPQILVVDDGVSTAAWTSDMPRRKSAAARSRSQRSAYGNGGSQLPAGRRYYNGRYFGNFNNRFYGPQYGYF